MSFSPEKLAERLALEGEKTVAFFSDLPEEAFALKLYADGEMWAVSHVFRHLVQAERAILRLMIAIVGGSSGVSEDFDLDAYNERKVREIETAGVPELIRLFNEARDRTIEWVSERSMEDLAITGRHPFLGVAPIEEMVKLLYRHPQLHQRDVRRCVDSEA